MILISKKLAKKYLTENQKKRLVYLWGYISTIYNPFPYRRYMKKHKCIFIHIPKAAGTSIRSMLGAPPTPRDHMPYSVYEQASPNLFKVYYKFTFVRNPWDRLVSSYFYLKKGGNGKEDLKYKEYFDKNFETFEKFVIEFLDVNIIYKHQLLIPQSLYLYDQWGSLKVDFVGKIENIERDFKEVSNHIGISLKIPKVNMSNHSDYKELYTEEMKSKVAKLYADDLHNFTYQF